MAGTALLAAGAVAVVAYVGAADGQAARPDWCERTESQVAVGYTYGVGDAVDVSFEPRGEGDLTVSVRTRSDGGAHTMQGLMGEARFVLPRRSTALYAPDGHELECSSVKPHELGVGAPPERSR